VVCAVGSWLTLVARRKVDDARTGRQGPLTHEPKESRPAARVCPMRAGRRGANRVRNEPRDECGNPMSAPAATVESSVVR
jgi:hypothetical protein